MKGILDRFEDNQKAVILIEEIDKEIVVNIEELPPGSAANTWFTIEEVNGNFKIISIDKETTDKQAETSSDLMKKLRAKSKGSKFNRK